MAVMSRKKKAVAQGWNSINNQRNEVSRKKDEEFEKRHNKEITPEEHEERMKKLRELGLIK